MNVSQTHYTGVARSTDKPLLKSSTLKFFQIVYFSLSLFVAFFSSSSSYFSCLKCSLSRSSLFLWWSFTLHHKRISAFIQLESSSHVLFFLSLDIHRHMYVLIPPMSVPCRDREEKKWNKKKFKVNSVVKI